jgi:hypothetical protein
MMMEVKFRKRASSARGNEVILPLAKKQDKSANTQLKDIRLDQQTHLRSILGNYRRTSSRNDWVHDWQHELILGLFGSVDDANTKVRQEWKDWRKKGQNHCEVEAKLKGEGGWHWTVNDEARDEGTMVEVK